MPKLDCVCFNGDASTIYEALVPLEDRLRLAENVSEDLRLSENKVCFVAYQEDIPVGILQAALVLSPRSAAFHSLYVVPEYRHQHVATKLLAMGVSEMQKEGISACTLIYTKEDPDTPFVEKILKAGGWQGPRPFMKRCRFDPSFDAPWMHHHYKYPPGFEEFLWKDLKKSDREGLIEKIYQGRIPRAVSPFTEEDKIEYVNSLGLRHHGEVVGWMVTHRLNQDVVRYSSLFIDPTLRNRGIIITLIVNSIKRHRKAPTHVLFEVPYLLVNSSWIHLVNKYTVPYAYNVTNVLQAWI